MAWKLNCGALVTGIQYITVSECANLQVKLLPGPVPDQLYVIGGRDNNQAGLASWGCKFQWGSHNMFSLATQRGVRHPRPRTPQIPRT